MNGFGGKACILCREARVLEAAMPLNPSFLLLELADVPDPRLLRGTLDQILRILEADRSRDYPTKEKGEATFGRVGFMLYIRLQVYYGL